jgi:RNA polymerase sigma-70 factor (ECF subfamily)
LTEDTKARRFRENVLSHLDAAYNLARWLSRSDTDAEDIVQEACLRAFRSFDGFRGDSARPWLLAIVRNSCYDWLRRNRRGDGDEAYDEEVHGGIDATPTAPGLASPEALFERAETRQRIDAAIAHLPAPFREVVVLRDIEDLSYKEIADVAQVPIGTVMSRLARGRRLLMSYLAQPGSGVGNGM